MTPEELAIELSQLVNAAEGRYSEAIVRIQDQLYRKLTGILKDLKTDSEGYILQTQDNRVILRTAESAFDDVIKNSVYQKAVEQTVGVVPDIDKLNEKYFETVSSNFKPYRNFIRSLQQQVIRDVNTYALNEGLIVNVKVPLNQILNQNINSGGSFSGMLNQLRTHITGVEGGEGRLLRYSKTFLSDTLFNYSRAYQQAVTSDLGLEFYLYMGGLTGAKGKQKGSRDFCISRAGKYYHHKEIESWAELNWAGKNKDTTSSSIFILAGGHNCRHSIIPVHELIVPKDVIDRAVDLGYYKKAA
jgi:hypothetical protein